MIVKKNWKRLLAKKETDQKVAFLLWSFQTMKGWCDRMNGISSVPLLGAPIVVTHLHHFLLRLWGSKDISDFQMLQRAHACTQDTVRLKKTSHSSRRPSCFGPDCNHQFDSKDSQNPANGKVSEMIKGLKKFKWDNVKSQSLKTNELLKTVKWL